MPKDVPNWMEKKNEDIQNLAARRIFLNQIIFKTVQHIVLLLVNYIASRLLRIAQSRWHGIVLFCVFMVLGGNAADPMLCSRYALC